MTTTVHFEEPPVAHRGRRGVSRIKQEIAQQLKDRPGEWAWIRNGKSRGAAASIAYHMKIGTSPAFRPEGSFEAVSRNVDGKYRIYARYIGEGGEYA